VTLRRIILSAGLLAVIGAGSFHPSLAPAQTSRPSRSKNTPQRKLSARQIAQRTSPSVVLLLTTDEGGNPIALGSGFFVQSNVIATAYHVIKDAPQIYAKLVGRNGRHKISSMGSSDENNDLALLRMDDVKGQPLKLGNLSRLRVGDEIYVMGNPEGLEGTFSRGNISAFRIPRPISDADLFDPVPEYIQITAPISHGSSGGPVLDERGEVIGVAAGIFTEGQNLNFAVPVSKLAALLRNAIYDDVIAAALRAPNNPYLVPLPVPEWQLVTSGGGNNYYVSRTRIKLTPERTLIAWVKIVPDDSPEGRTSRKETIDLLNTQNVNRSYAFSYSMNQWEFDCGHQRNHLLRIVDYDEKGDLLYDWGDNPAGANWKPVLPDSVGEAELSFVCKGRQ
jgi:hypothetical protein